MHEAPSVFARADALAELPRLGGMARADGVAIVSERYWAFAHLPPLRDELRRASPPDHAARGALLAVPDLARDAGARPARFARARDGALAFRAGLPRAARPRSPPPRPRAATPDDPRALPRADPDGASRAGSGARARAGVAPD